jgi:CreA protein
MKILFAILFMFSSAVIAEEVGCVSTTFRLLGANDKVCINSFKDPAVNVICHVSQARTGGVKGTVGLAEDPSKFSLACVKTGIINTPLNIKDSEEVFSEKTNIFFKDTNITRFYDKPNNTLIYLAISRKLIDGSPANSISSVYLNGKD